MDSGRGGRGGGFLDSMSKCNNTVFAFPCFANFS